MRRIATPLFLIAMLTLTGCADLEALLTDTRQDIAVVQDEIDKERAKGNTELADKMQAVLDDAKAVHAGVNEVYEAATEDVAGGADAAGSVATSLGYPEVGLVLTTIGALIRARHNRKVGREAVSTSAPAIPDTSKVAPQSPSAKRLVDEAQGKKLALPF